MAVTLMQRSVKKPILSRLIHPAVVPLAMSLVCVGTIPALGAENVATISLSDAHWWIHDDADGQGGQRGMPLADVAAPGWIPATVPGNLQADLERARLIPPFWFESDDPLLAKPPKSGASISWAEMWNRRDFTVPGGDPRLAEVARKDWWYRKDFTVPPSFEGRQVRLVFDGVDHECEVYLNGNKIGGHGGMYRQVGYDLGTRLRPGQVHRLAVRIARMPPSLDRHIGMPSQIKAYRHELSEIKAPSYGLDWGLGVYPLGIWKDVRLEASGLARIDDVRIQTRLEEPYLKANVIARLEVDSQERLAVKARFRIEGHGAGVASEVRANLLTGSNTIEAALALEHPALWWPNGQGEQPIYRLISELVDAQGNILHTRTKRFGVRDIKWVPVADSPHDASVRSQLVVNGRMVRLLGSNIIPVDLLPGRQHAKADWLLRMAHQAQMNVVRNWAGTTMRDEWYDLADELGIMIQQEMPATNSGEGWPEEYSAYTAAMERTAISIIKQLRNHPSLVEWTGGNEMGWPGNDSPIPTMLRRLVAEMDDRIFRVTDPEPGWAHGPYNAAPDQFYRSYNAPPAPRRDEFGAPGPAHLETWYRDIPPSSQWPLRPDDPVLVAKNVFYGWVGNTWLQPHVIKAQFGPLRDLASLIRAGQWISADELRYAMDAMRRGGLRTSGFMNWVFNEPWSNGAGNTVVDYDGRPLMNYHLARQALAPISLSLMFDSLRYKPDEGLRFEVWLTSDAPSPAKALSWQLLARDRHGRVFATDQGTTSVEPLQAKPLKAVSLAIPGEISLGPLFVETQVLDAQGKTLQERLQIFGCDLLVSPFRGLLGGPSPFKEGVSDVVYSKVPGHREVSKNLASVANGAKPALASSARPEPWHQPAGINDGKYGNDSSWIPTRPKSSFQIELREAAELSLFKLGRDRNGKYSDRWVDYLKIETSQDGSQWQTVFEQTGIKSLADFNPAGTMQIRIHPTLAQFVRGTVEAQSPETGEFPCIDEFEAFAMGDNQSGLARVSFESGQLDFWRAVAPTTIVALPSPSRVAGDQEVLVLRVSNTGPMTALFCEPHPLIEYRTDLFIENDYCFIPPGQSRTITIRAATSPGGGLTLAQTGWRLSCWNADDVVIEPAPDVLLAVGRRDCMSREYRGYDGRPEPRGAAGVSLQGRRPDPVQLPLLQGDRPACFKFSVAAAQARRSARLRLHTADQSKEISAIVEAKVNGRRFEATLRKGLGVQNSAPAHLAFPESAAFELPRAALRSGTNTLEIRVRNNGWFTWDAMDLISREK